MAQWFQRRRRLKMLTEVRQTTDAGVIGILIAHLRAISSGELKQYSLTFDLIGDLICFLYPHLLKKVSLGLACNVNFIC